MSRCRPPPASSIALRSEGSWNASASRAIAGSCWFGSPSPDARCSMTSRSCARGSSGASSMSSTTRSCPPWPPPWPTSGSPSRARSRTIRPCTTRTYPRGGVKQPMEAFPTTEEYVPSLEEDPALGLSHRAKMEILFAVMLGLFLGALDQTIVGPALPTIVTQLSGNDYYVWAITIYLLTSTISVPFWGKLSDLYGRKPIYMLGIVIFLIGSALSGLSQNMAMLILFRGLQGIGAGALFPVALSIIGDMFTPKERGKYQGLFGAVFGIAFVAGPLIGGWLTENLSWHWIFYVNIPIGIVALVVIQRLLPTVKTASASRNFDLVGGAIFTVSMVFLLLGLTFKQSGEWTDWNVGGFIIIGIVGTLLFILAEARAKEPIVPLG